MPRRHGSRFPLSDMPPKCRDGVILSVKHEGHGMALPLPHDDHDAALARPVLREATVESRSSL